MTKFICNDHIHTSICSSPFMLDTRQNPQISMELLKECGLETQNNFTSKMDTATQAAHSTLTQAADDMAQFYNVHRREVPLYVVGDKVWLNGQNITMTQPLEKLDHKWLSPYSVDEVNSWSAHWFKLPSSFGHTQ